MLNSKINKNSITPNGIQKDADGYAVFYPMGTNKVDIPKNSPHWPKGNKLIGQFVYKDDKLVGFCDTKAMTATSGDIIVMPYETIDTEFDSIEKDSIQIHAPKAVIKKASWTGSDGKIDIPDVEYKYKGCKNVNAIKTVDANYLENDIVDDKWTELLSDMTNSGYMFQENENITSFTSDLSSLINGSNMFAQCPNLSTFDSDLSSLSTGYEMFRDCSNMTYFETSNLNNLNDARAMFYNCSNMTSFNKSLKYITNGGTMFQNCYKITTISSDFSSLIDGFRMFMSCYNLNSFTNDIPSLATAGAMFCYCHNIISFNSNLKSLSDGESMFCGCERLVSFKSNLSSLILAHRMFENCKLDAPSIKNIIDTINIVETGEITLGMGCDNNQTDKDLFAQEVGYSDMNTLLQVLQDKGWTVRAQYNGRPSTTFSLRKPDSLPVYAKLVEVVLPIDEEEISPIYEYTSNDGSKFYNLDWFHETTGSTDGYTQFNSLEESITHFNIKPIEK